MNLKQPYWTYYKHPYTNWSQVVKATWKDDMIDRQRFQEKRVFVEEAHAKRALEVVNASA